MKTKGESLCNYCDNAMANCPWSISFEPVPNWEAIPVKIPRHDPPHDASYLVVTCPMFEPYKRLSQTKKLIGDEYNG